MSNVLLAGRRVHWREACERELSDRGYRVDTVESGLDCLSRMRTDWPDLLVLADELPWGGTDGVMAVIKDDPWLSQIPVVLTDFREHSLDTLRPSTSPLVAAVAELIPHAPAADAVGTLPPADSLEVLVVDDDPVVRDMLHVCLERQGFRVWTAGNGEEALDLCCEQGEHLAVVLLDVHMPALDGPHTFEGLQAYDPSLPVCFMSAHVSDAEAADLLRFGARHVFRKPFRLDDVARVVRALANEARAVGVKP